MRSESQPSRSAPSPERDVVPNLKPDPITCVDDGCGLAKCTAVGQPTRTGHPRGCVCPRCIGRRNKRKGQRKQAKATTALGVPRSTISPGHEEYLGGAVRIEVKAGAQVGPILTRYLAMEAQSEAARPFGDHRPFVAVAMPEKVSWGIVLIRTDRLEDAVAALAEQLGVVA